MALCCVSRCGMRTSLLTRAVADLVSHVDDMPSAFLEFERRVLTVTFLYGFEPYKYAHRYLIQAIGR